jgi:uncharacterized protein YraI
MHRLITGAAFFAILLAVFLLSGTVPSHAGGTGKYTVVYFPGSDATKCGRGWYASAASYDEKDWVDFTRPAVVTFKVTDGTGKVIQQGTQNLLNGFAANVTGLKLPAYGMPDTDFTGAKNPIHVFVSVDGDVVADLTADNPCLPGGPSAKNAAPAQPSACSLRTTYNGLRARSDPGAKSPVVGGLTSGTAYPVLAKGTDSAGSVWWQVSIAGVGSAWVSGAYVKTSGDCSGVPTAGGSPQSRPASTPAQNTATCTVRTQTDGLRLRSGPGADYQLVGQMENGKDYPVLGQNRDTSGARWWQINAGSLGEVWVKGGFVVTHGTCTGVPTITAPPKA